MMDEEPFRIVATELIRLMLCRSAATAVFNEGNLLNLVLWAAEGQSCVHGVRVNTRNWRREAIPLSPFVYSPGRARQTDAPRPDEGFTKLDAVLGDFQMRPRRRSGIELIKDGLDLVVLEAKLGSTLSEGVTNVGYWDQGVRSVLCMTHMAILAGWNKRPNTVCTFFVVAPQQMITAGAFADELDKSNMVAKIERRISDYSESERLRFETSKRDWLDFINSPRLTANTLSWEELIDEVTSSSPESQFSQALLSFYQECKVANDVSSKAAAIQRNRSSAQLNARAEDVPL
jgi:hypothetical protein